MNSSQILTIINNSAVANIGAQEPTLLELPAEIICVFASYLEPHNLLNFALTSKQIFAIIGHEVEFTTQLICFNLLFPVCPMIDLPANRPATRIFISAFINIIYNPSTDINSAIDKIKDKTSQEFLSNIHAMLNCKFSDITLRFQGANLPLPSSANLPQQSKYPWKAPILHPALAIVNPSILCEEFTIAFGCIGQMHMFLNIFAFGSFEFCEQIIDKFAKVAQMLFYFDNSLMIQIFELFGSFTAPATPRKFAPGMTISQMAAHLNTEFLQILEYHEDINFPTYYCTNCDERKFELLLQLCAKLPDDEDFELPCRCGSRVCNCEYDDEGDEVNFVVFAAKNLIDDLIHYYGHFNKEIEATDMKCVPLCESDSKLHSSNDAEEHALNIDNHVIEFKKKIANIISVINCDNSKCARLFTNYFIIDTRKYLPFKYLAMLSPLVTSKYEFIFDSQY